MKIGDTNEVKIMVTDEVTATAAGSGALRVFGTPFLVAAMENAGLEYIARELPEGKSSVGIMVNAEHTAPTPVGMEVTVKVTVTNISANGKIVDFDMEAFDQFLLELDYLSEYESCNFVVSATLDESEASETVKKYL